MVIFFFFFFQAEDGIRDHCVTGVQTCALPILQSPMTGGKQERSRRAGTENVAGIVGLGAAAQLARGKMAAEAERLAALRDRLEEGVLARVAGTAINGLRSPRVPNTTNISF